MKKENILKLLIVLIGIVSITINFMVFEDWRGIFYYTVLSNIYVTCFYAVTLFLDLKGKLKKTNNYYMLKGLMLLAILCTMIVFFVAINGQDNVYKGHPIACYSVHLLIPILTLLECALFENKKVLKYRYIVGWLITSLLYTLVLVIYRTVFHGVFLEGKTYPYDIMNFEELGLTKGLTNCFIILAFFALVGFIIVFVDNKMEKPLLGGEKK